nr:uncharacterized protein K02A2.6-like [Leptinotarsa decemlineata]
MTKQDIIEPIEASNWGTPVLPILKTDNTIRICGDYKTTLNECSENVRYPLPRIEEIFAKLNGGKSFTKLDLYSAYLQFILDEKSQEMATLNTHKGLYRMKRLPFGVAPASATLQRSLEQLFQGMEGVIIYMDDVVVTGRTTEELMRNLEMVLERMKDTGLTLNKDKCNFFKEEIEYLGHIIDSKGLRKTSDEVEAVLNAPRPRTVSQVRSFTGLVNYYAKFLPNLAMVMNPLYKLLKKGDEKLEWNEETERSFNLTKKLMAEDMKLSHFDPSKEILLASDASSEGISSVLFHRENGKEKPIGCVSRTLMPVEKKYATIDKEALAIVFGLKKFEQYLRGNRVIIKTDHKPLVSLFGESKGIPERNRDLLQRWAVFIAASFDYKIEYVKGRKNHMPYCLSRIPLHVNIVSREHDTKGYLYFAASTKEWPVENERVRQATNIDEELRMVKKFIEEGWPQKWPECVKPYLRRRDELMVEQGCILWGHRIVIPKILRRRMLEELHTSHLGIVKTKSLARSYMWWPGLDQEVEKHVRACNPCQENKENPPKEVV